MLGHRVLAGFLGSALLAAVVIGSGIAAVRLSPGNLGLELFENAVSGAHLNPIVSALDALLGGISWRDTAAYLPAQVGGCCGGALLANLMFASAAVSLSAECSERDRSERR